MNEPDLTTTTGTTAAAALGLGLDAGGTQTRWALADAAGALLAEGAVASISGLQMGSAAGRDAVAGALHDAARAARQAARRPGALSGVVAGITGFDSASLPALCALAADAFALPLCAVHTMSDIELACHAAFAPGAGYVVYAGTGSVAAFIDDAGALHRVGGHGVVIDDAGGGHWIAREALRRVWRAEDENPGAWHASPLAVALFARIGGSDWPATRSWVYGASRGELGTLALAVAAAADADPAALAILDAAGRELARLAQVLLRRHGHRPLALAGRVFDLHPAVENALRGALSHDATLTRLTQPPHHAAARLAARH